MNNHKLISLFIAVYVFMLRVLAPIDLTLAQSSDDEVEVISLENAERVVEVQRFDYDFKINCISFSPDNTRLALGGGGKIELWDLVNSELSWEIARGGSPYNLAFSPDGKVIAAAGLEPAIEIYDAVTGEIKSVIDFVGSPSDLEFAPDGEALATGTSTVDYRVWLYDAEGNTIAVLGDVEQAHSNNIWRVGFSPDGAMLATGGTDMNVVIWDLADNSFKKLVGHSGRVNGLAYSPDGATLASSGNDSSIRIWDVVSGQEVAAFEDAQWGTLNRLTFSPKGDLLAVISSDQQLDDVILLINPANGEVLSVLRGHSDEIRDIVFSTDGTLLASASADQSIRLWSVPQQ